MTDKKPVWFISGIVLATVAVVGYGLLGMQDEPVQTSEEAENIWAGPAGPPPSSQTGLTIDAPAGFIGPSGDPSGR